MVIDFSKIDLQDSIFILKTLSCDPIQTLGYAFDRSASIQYNDISEIGFSYPAYVNGKKVNGYDDLVGMRIIDILNIGQFILIDPAIEQDGTREYKKCKGYSLEYEFTFKKISIENGTYNFWNPVSPKDTVMGRMMEKMPTWSIGEIDSSLIGKYRTFEENDSNLYHFMKSSLQDIYHCIFEFDTYRRVVNVRDVNAKVSISPVFLSLDNLLKQIDIKEDTENIFTVLDVNGAEGVDIRSVNPTGTNKIYNLDYFMNETNFSSDMIEKWNTWKTTLQNSQLQYYNLTIEQALQTSKRLSEQAVLSDLSGDLQNLENLRSVYAQAVAQGMEEKQSDLDEVNIQIQEKEAEIDQQKEIIEETQSSIDDITEQLSSINKSLAFESFFTLEEILVLNRYFKEDSIEESSFVAPKAESYNATGTSNTLSGTNCSISSADITKVTDAFDQTLFSIKGGSITLDALKADIIRASMQQRQDGSFLFSAYLSAGSYQETSFASGCISMTGTSTSVVDDTVPDAEITDAYFIGTSLSFYVLDGTFYFTKNTTEYEQRSIEWDLYDYGMECLDKLSSPSYTFSVESANFLTLKDFASFQNNLILGDKIYLALSEDRILSPVLVQVEIDFEDLSSISFGFSDTFSYKDSAFQLVDLLDQSISMGKNVDFSKYKYSAFIDSGAETSVKKFMDSALDVAKNAIISSAEQAISWDSSGIHLRQWDETKTGYLDEQIRMVNNSIVFTDDGWKTAKMAIGKFVDTNSGESWGVVAPSIVGTLLAGENLIIESTKKDGDIAVFRVDGNGASLHNSKFDILNAANTQILLDPTLGIGIGSYPLVTVDDNDHETWDTDRAKFWVDMDGNLHIKGTLEAADGTFSGVVRASDFQTYDGNQWVSMLTQDSKWQSDYLDLKGLEIKNDKNNTTFKIDQNGNVTISGTIEWGASNSPVLVQYSVDGTSNWHEEYNDSDFFARYSYNGGASWTKGIRIQGKNGTDGVDGSDANVPPWVQAYTSSAQYNTLIQDEWVISMNLYGTNIFGANYYSEDKNTHMDLLSKNDYKLGVGGGVKFSFDETDIFTVCTNDFVTSVDFYSYGKQFLGVTRLANGEQYTMPVGNWNLVSCNITYWGGNIPPAVFS